MNKIFRRDQTLRDKRRKVEKKPPVYRNHIEEDYWGWLDRQAAEQNTQMDEDENG